MGSSQTTHDAQNSTMAPQQSASSLTPICNIVTPVGMLGYGLDTSLTAEALTRLIPNGAPTAIILDSGSTDSGPEKLALGCMSTPRMNYVRDLTKLIQLCWQYKVPLLFSSAGGDGSDEHVKEMLDVVEEIVQTKGNEYYALKTLAIYSEIPKQLITSRLSSGAITGCGKPVPPLSQSSIDAAPRIVSQMGPEPFVDAMLSTPDFNIIVGGRAYDPSPYIAFAAYASKTPFHNTATLEAQRLWGGFAHMGKILECGGLCATPKSNGATATVYHDGTFDITPTDTWAVCTPISVSAHTLYEKTRPDVLHGPGGWLDLTMTEYRQLDDGRTCRVSGGMFTFSRDVGEKYEVKLEAAAVAGYRASYMGSFHDPILISQLDDFLRRIKVYVAQQHEGVEGTWDLDFHVYGLHEGLPSEVFLIGEALASTQALATSIVSTAKVATVHGPYPGQKATSGNFAHGHGGKLVMELGPCAQFSIYHLMALEEGEERLKLGPESPGLYRQEVAVIGTGIGPEPEPLSLKPSDTKKKRVTSASGIPTTPPKLQGPPKTLSDVAYVLRSKNAGPFEITFDVMFANRKVYDLVKHSDILNTVTIAKIFELQEDDIIWNGFFNQALAYKATIPRLWKGKPVASGGFMENDVHGSQKYIGLMNMELPENFIRQWQEVSPLS